MTGQADYHTTGCLLNYPYSTENYKMVALDLNKQQELDAALKAISKTNVTGNIDQAGNTTMLFITKEAKETILDFSQETVRVF